MAATTMSAWGKPGGWALDSEENESELLQQHKKDVAAASNGGDTADFPSLAAAATTKTKKKKPQAISLQEFTTYGAAKPSAQTSAPKGLTQDELLMLPTGPKERSAEELERGKLGGGFRSYGTREENPRRQGSFNRESNREFVPSRADETDNWGSGKKFSPVSGDRRERGGFFSDSQSRATDSDNWGSNKTFVPSEPRRYDKRGSFGSDSSSGASDSNTWVKEGRKIGGGGAFDSLRERRGGFESNGVDSDSWGKRREEESGGITVGGVRPRLNLKPRTLPVEPRTLTVEPKTLPVDEVQKSFEIVVKPKGSNPFGEARPREEVLKEKGVDVKEIEEKLELTKIKDIVAGDDGKGAGGKKGFWSANGGEERKVEERAWRRPGSVEAGRVSAEETANGHEEINGNNAHAEEVEGRDTEI